MSDKWCEHTFANGESLPRYCLACGKDCDNEHVVRFATRRLAWAIAGFLVGGAVGAALGQERNKVLAWLCDRHARQHRFSRMVFAAGVVASFLGGLAALVPVVLRVDIDEPAFWVLVWSGGGLLIGGLLVSRLSHSLGPVRVVRATEARATIRVSALFEERYGRSVSGKRAGDVEAKVWVTSLDRRQLETLRDRVLADESRPMVERRVLATADFDSPQWRRVLFELAPRSR